MDDVKMRVLIVNDQDETLRLFGDFLALKGFDPSTASNGMGGFQKSQELVPDVILMDLNMPDMLGVDVCRMIRESPKTSHIPIIIVTASQVTSRDKVWGFRSGADDYMVLPFELEELGERVRAVMLRSQRNPKLPPQAPLPSPRVPDLTLPPIPALPLPSMSVPQAELGRFDLCIAAARWEKIFHSPKSAFDEMAASADMRGCFALVLCAPLLASLGTASGPGGVAGWLANLFIGSLGAVAVWAAISLAAYLLLPFLGADLTWEKAAFAAAFAAAPKIPGALLSTVYAVLAPMMSVAVTHEFSSGLDLLLLQQPAHWFVRGAARIGIFDCWSSFLLICAIGWSTRLVGRKYFVMAAVMGALSMICGLAGPF